MKASSAFNRILFKLGNGMEVLRTDIAGDWVQIRSAFPEGDHPGVEHRMRKRA
jgi:hypothetical protein